MSFAWDVLFIFAAAFIAGMVNSVAGGGTLISFPALVWIGVDPIKANATNTVALWPGSLAGMFGLRHEIGSARRLMLILAAPSILGSLTGALLLLRTPSETFAVIVPFLILFATILFAAQEAVQRSLAPGVSSAEPTPKWQVGAALFQFAVALYGGYFGAGIGILMLAALGLLGLTDIHQMNGLKNFFAATINGVAAVYFIWSKTVSWPHAVVMAAGAIAGGLGGAGLARRLGRQTVRRLVILIGVGMALSLLLRHLSWFS